MSEQLIEESPIADWCDDYGNLTICGTRMEEYSRTSEGVKWCFTCRKRHEFWWVVEAPVGISYYEPIARMEGINHQCTDLFPGRFREDIDE